ncbi:FAD dependent oxidoreductase [Cordyceps fumosorosea ARSEF 2679]|uniref:FAD dependent oxidoreductase n=1 Tax=Cordyceps fumosorosea (strain ARSEF 2679) TaxID=1081104 RepID=A0A167R212_CORFA|nr:FAD dependent oxidoreductase [Cordyceps fumosorosea ARSEF 2679]OAA58196.1 FAD dependent oxidoreductase [Cordyceps fumosorosea ARSEF 2679]
MDKQDPIIVVGAGIFGLSTALHLAEAGYADVTVFDRHAVDKTRYSYFDGCDGASADASKIIRSAYGGQKEYTDLSAEAIVLWNAWNEEIKTVDEDNDLGLSRDDVIWNNNGVLMCTDQPVLSDFDRASARNANPPGGEKLALVTNDPEDRAVAEAKGLAHALSPFAKPTVGVLDTTGGVVVADKACCFALYKARKAGAKFILGGGAGTFSSLLKNGEAVAGIKTADGKEHPAKTVVMACGGWTPSLVPALDGLCETTAGSVLLYQLPEGSPLRRTLGYAEFPAFMFRQREGVDGGLYGFPADRRGVVKIGYRGIKYTNPVAQADGLDRSVPRTRWTTDDAAAGRGEDTTGAITDIPAKAHQVISDFVGEFLPALVEGGRVPVKMSRLCWYTDSFDNHYVVDRVPGVKGLACATAGSGHAFKYLPNVGAWVVSILEGRGLDRPLARAWRWRALEEGREPVNKLMLGREDGRTLANTELVTAEEEDGGLARALASQSLS